jgi:hypothetical protein
MILKRKLESQETKTAIMERFMYADVAKVMTSKEKVIFFFETVSVHSIQFFILNLILIYCNSYCFDHLSSIREINLK